VNATAGTAPFHMGIDGVTTQNGPNPHTFPNVSAGTHFVTITDNSGCTFTINNIIVNAGPELQPNTSSTNAACATATNGTITVTSASGTGLILFQLMEPPRNPELFLILFLSGGGTSTL